MPELTRAQIEEVLSDAVGAPSSGPVAEVLPLLVDAMDAALHPAPVVEARIVKAKETR
jgi:hypothetical protein